MNTASHTPSQTKHAAPLGGSFAVTPPADGIVTLTFDVAGQRMNTLKPGLEIELQALLARLAADDAVEGVVFASGKQGSFIAGADIEAISRAKDAAEASAVSRALGEALTELSQLWTRHKKPVVAAIDGPCLGGGLELALACSDRVATDSSKTVLGLPEVKLGLIPGGGGTQRLPRLIGVTTALDLILTGKNVVPKKAQQMGLVDEVVPQQLLLTAAAARARKQARAARAGSKRPTLIMRAKRAAFALSKPGALQKVALEENRLGQAVVFHQASKALQKQTGGHYPAPVAAIAAIKEGLTYGLAAGLKKEAELFGELCMSQEAKALIGLYNASQNLKKDTGASDAEHKARPVQLVGIVGAGQMGAGIAQVSMFSGQVAVRMQERDQAGLVRGLASVGRAVEARVRKKKMHAREVPRVKSLLSGTTDWQGIGKADVVIEAVFEDLALKQQILAEVEARGGEHTIFASNTSSIPISDIAAKAKRPQNVVGMHYFSPVEKMPLLEIIKTAKTSAQTIATCVALGKAQGKTVIVVGDGPGFYTTRILTPYLMEAAWLIGEGYEVERIDRALTAFGFPVGPVTLMDEVGLDTGAKVCKVMHAAMGERIALPPGLDALIADKRLGRKNGRGFYLYEQGKKGGVDHSAYACFGQRSKSPKKLSDRDLANRVLLQMVNEAARCLEEGKLRSAEDGDIGAIFGLGFPPFLGGPFAYIDRMTPGKIVAELEALVADHGARFTPAAILRQYAESGRHFR